MAGTSALKAQYFPCYFNPGYRNHFVHTKKQNCSIKFGLNGKFKLAQVLALIKKVNVPDEYLIHISQRLGLYTEVEKQLLPKVHPAYDGLVPEL
jgi:hypothetical protein